MAIEVILDRKSPDHSRIRAALEDNLGELEKISYRTSSEAIPPGELGSFEEITRFIIENYDQIVPILNALLAVLMPLLVYLLQKKDAKPPVVIVVDGKELKIPSSKAEQAKFLKLVEKADKRD